MRNTLFAVAVSAALAPPAVWAGAEDMLKNMELSGLVELEANVTEPDEGDSTSDFTVATVELTLAAPVNDWIQGEIVFLYEQDETDFGVDSATVSIAPPDGPWFVNAGLFAVPFGRFETNLVSDPLTLEMGEMYESAVQLGMESNGFTASAYIFNGDSDKDGDDKIDNFGLDFGYAMESEDRSFAIGAGYINHLGDTDALQDAMEGVADYVPGWFFSA